MIERFSSGVKGGVSNYVEKHGIIQVKGKGTEELQTEVVYESVET